jgi:hypothetical protein
MSDVVSVASFVAFFRRADESGKHHPVDEVVSGLAVFGESDYLVAMMGTPGLQDAPLEGSGAGALLVDHGARKASDPALIADFV